MKTLAELNPKVGNTVTFHSPYPQNCGDFRVEETPSVTFRWSLRPVGGGAAWWPTEDANQPVWTFSVQSAPEPRYTLLQLNPKVGEVVLAHQNNGVSHEYRILCKWLEGGFRLRNVHTGGEWDCDYKVAGMPMWTLNPQPKEKQVTVSELNLSVGDRVTDGNRQGTVTNVFGNLCSLLWDWSDKYQQVAKTEPASFTKLPKPEPTLASLNLKEGDPVLNTRNNRCALVYSVDSSYVFIRYSNNETLTLFQTDPISRLKKLEVPK